MPEEVGDKSGQPYLQLFRWAPRGNAYAFVYENNIYYR